LLDLLAWIEGTAFSTWTRESPSLWAYPAILTLHTFGLGVVVGLSAVIDLRLLDRGRRIPLSSLLAFFPLIAAAFALNAATGIALFMSAATTKGVQPVFYLKLTLIGFALWDTVLARRLIHDGVARGDVVDRSRARLIASTSLVLWAGAITTGRLMAYL